jgi:hypothetical protein
MAENRARFNFSRRAMRHSIQLLAIPLLAFSMLAQTPRAPGALNDHVTGKPDFSGRWRMVKDKSNFAGFTTPDLLVQIVEDRSPTLNIHTVQTRNGKTSTADVTYFTDGRESSNVINGRDALSKTYWDGSVLVVRTDTKDSKNDDVEMEDRWELSQDKQTLTRSSHIVTSTGGEVNMMLVCQKEKAS